MAAKTLAVVEPISDECEAYAASFLGTHLHRRRKESIESDAPETSKVSAISSLVPQNDKRRMGNAESNSLLNSMCFT